MNPLEMVVAIILIATVGRVLQTRYRYSASTPPQPVQSADTMRLHDEVRQLKERIVVLERVITDNRSSLDLDREIERLRER